MGVTLEAFDLSKVLCQGITWYLGALSSRHGRHRIYRSCVSAIRGMDMTWYSDDSSRRRFSREDYRQPSGQCPSLERFPSENLRDARVGDLSSLPHARFWSTCSLRSVSCKVLERHATDFALNDTPRMVVPCEHLRNLGVEHQIRIWILNPLHRDSSVSTFGKWTCPRSCLLRLLLTATTVNDAQRRTFDALIRRSPSLMI